MNEHERRGAARVPYISDVIFIVGGKRLTARTSDLSATGVFINSKMWCDPRTMMTLSFSVCSTQIETAAQVRYSIPLIGMGVRFVDLKPEHRAAIEKLVECHDDPGDCEELGTKPPHTMPSGVEPVDILLGGLERGHLYLTHGDASGKSLFGVEFLIEGLKSGQPGALITPQRKEEAIRRFTRVGYDCERDLSSGALVIHTYSNDIVEQIRQRLDLEPLLLELGPMLDESSPERIVFDPVDSLMAAEHGAATERANQLAAWVKSFGATSVLVSTGENRAVIESLMPSVRDSFRFEVRESSDRVVRFITFEKSPSVPDQAVRVDPSRGISLMEDRQPDERSRSAVTVEVESSEDFQGGSIAASPIPQPADGLALDSNFLSQPVVHGEGDLFFAMLVELQSFVSSIDPDTDEAANNALASTHLREPDRDVR